MKAEESQVNQLLDGSLTRRDIGRYASALAALAAVGPGRVAAQSSPDRPRGGSVTIARANDADSLDPHHTTGPSWDIINNVNDQLVCINDKLEYEGILAESWDISPDGLEYTFHLRPGITFHDGTAVDAAAFKFTFDRMMDPKTNAPAAGWIKPLKETVAVDPQTLKLILSEPFSALIGQLCLNYFCPLPPAAVQQMGDDFGRHPIGAGPFKFKEWVPGATITLERNEHYQNFHTYNTNRGAPYLDQIVFSAIPQADTQIAALESGEVQIVGLPPREVKRFQDDDAYQVVIDRASVGINFIEFNMVKPTGAFGAQWKPPFDDIRLRQAVAYAVDPDSVIENVYYGLATRNYGPMPTGLFAYKPEIEQYGYHPDPAKAKALLDEAGWVAGSDGVRAKDGVKLDLKFWTWNDGGTNEKILQIFQNQLAQVGIKTELDVLDAGTWIATKDNGDWNLNLEGWGWPEPNLLKMIAESVGGMGDYHDETYMTLLDKATQTSVQAERTDFYFQAAQKMLADAAIVPLWSDLSARAVRKEVKDFKPGPQMYGTYNDIYLEK
jgi:peptide/nickel transport system substrate-binding protein